MPKINQDLLDRLSAKLDITERAVYPRIQKIVKKTGLERDLAALMLARRNDININRFSTLAQRNAIRRNARVGRGDQEPERERQPAPLRRASKVKKSARKTKGKSVFVVHGRGEALRMFDFLRALRLHPLEWDHALKQARCKGANPYVGDILEEVMKKAQAVVVTFSPGDLVHLKEQFLHTDDRSTEGEPHGQARPNVLFEAGLAMGRHQDKTLLVQVGRVKPFSDIGGRHMLRLNDSPESRNDLANRLECLGLRGAVREECRFICESARGPDADRRVKLLIQFAVGGHSRALIHTSAQSREGCAIRTYPTLKGIVWLSRVTRFTGVNSLAFSK